MSMSGVVSEGERDPRRTAQAWCEAWNRRDLDAVMSHYAADVVFTSPTVVTRWGHADGTLRGRDALREHFARGITAPNLRFTLQDVLRGVAETTVLYRRETGALVADANVYDVHGHIVRAVATYGEPDPSATLAGGLDHLVLNCTDVERTIAFYVDALGAELVHFGEGRRALRFGPQKINLHQLGNRWSPLAAVPTAGSADYCLVAAVGPDEVRARLEAAGVPIELGPVPKTGARGPITSHYVRDPDGNLVELGAYG
ncbi:MAG TPA: nuclear transport factor 2 family protein [Candidatus Sulfotelmatobacter sp.]|nr:nuclear transport factor 2 family protein [Candidatus Sulfotelmatobacter sp.]